MHYKLRCQGFGNGVPVGYGPAMGRDRIELALIAALIVAVAAMAVLIAWPWISR